MDGAGKRGGARRLWELFLNTLYISTFTFGGGFVIVTLMKKKFVDELKWIDEEEMLDITAMAQSSPGAIAVNAAMLVGWRVAGLAGMLAALLGTILPPLVILSVVSLFYAAFASNRAVALVLAGMQAGVAAVILDVVLTTGRTVVQANPARAAVLMVLAFAANVVFKVNIIFIILGAILLSVLSFLLGRRGGSKP